ncbi:serine carboxypeptidase S28-domain-containing protein [Pavlovales sp. CCMP2436]|nr:serine carboxypeptidase S28-domain-containing protein [Pavlovales sp. CCMP2436]
MLAGFLLLAFGTVPWQQHVREHLAEQARPRLANEASLQLVPVRGRVRRPVQRQEQRGVARGPQLRPNTSDVSLHLVRQPLDHYDATDTRSWTQRVFVRRAFFDGTGPVFVCVGGEGPPLDASSLVASPHCNDAVELAAVVGALLVAVEHRYFGPSADVRPLPSFDTESLRYLSSSQAVEDLINVHAAVSLNYSLTHRNRWVTFGGSYPGLVAGYARLRLPHLRSSICRSTTTGWHPRWPTQRSAARRTARPPCATGTPSCCSHCAQRRAGATSRHPSICAKRALSTRALLRSPGQAAERSSLAHSPTTLAAAIPPVTSAPSANYSPSPPTTPPPPPPPSPRPPPSAPPPPPPKLQALRRLAAVNAKQRAGACIPTMELDPTVALAELLNTSSPARAWPYQTCAEYGFFQTCEVGSECPFARGALSLSGSFEMCRRAFGISAAEVAVHVARTNARYGGNRPAASRVLFINGDVDPWSALGVLASPDGNRSEPVYLAAGASHHSWTHPADSIVQPSVRRAKELVWHYVTQWLHEIDVSF